MFKQKWDEQYEENQFTYGKTVNAFIKEKNDLFPSNSKIACFAEGEGRNAVHLAKLGHQVTAYDISSVGLKHAHLLADENNVTIETIEADLTKDNSISELYDGAIMVFGQIGKAKQETFFSNMIDSVKPDGYIMLEVYSEVQLNYHTGGPNHKKFLYDPIDVLKWINDFHCVHFYYGEMRREEGYRHTGMSHVIQAIIQK